MIMPIDILNYLYCPRYIYFQYVLNLPQFEEKYYLVEKGREIHDLKKVRNKEYLRKKVGAVKKYISLYMSNGKLRGRPDEVLELADGTMAALDYKFSEYKEKIFEPVRQQMIAYSILIEDTFKKASNKAFLVFVRSKNKLIELEITDKDKSLIRKTIDEVLRIINNEIFPDVRKSDRKCVKCTYKNICVP